MGRCASSWPSKPVSPTLEARQNFASVVRLCTVKASSARTSSAPGPDSFRWGRIESFEDCIDDCILHPLASCRIRTCAVRPNSADCNTGYLDNVDFSECPSRTCSADPAGNPSWAGCNSARGPSTNYFAAISCAVYSYFGLTITKLIKHK